jgi:hypothetical protein
MTRISLETDKLAKEKGIDLSQCRCGGFPECICRDKRPIQSLLQKLLRENYDIHIMIEPVETKKGDRYEWTLISSKFIDEDEECDLTLKTYEECLEDALQEALKLI